MNWRDYIESNSEILGGKPIVKDTRISVELILDLLSKGWTKEQLLDNYPALTDNSITAVFAFVAEAMHDEALYFIKRDAA